MKSRRWIYRFLGLALLLAMLLAGWMAWQSRGGMAQLQGESIAGWTIDSVQVESVESGQLRFEQLQLSQDGQGGSRIELELQGVQVDFSLFKRHVDLLTLAGPAWRLNVEEGARVVCFTSATIPAEPAGALPSPVGNADTPAATLPLAEEVQP